MTAVRIERISGTPILAATSPIGRRGAARAISMSESICLSLLRPLEREAARSNRTARGNSQDRIAPRPIFAPSAAER